MSTAGDLAPAPPVPPVVDAEKPNTFQRIVGVLFSPGETFESIARRPNIVGPFLIYVVISIIGGIFAITRVDWAAAARETIEANPNVPADRVEGMISTTAKFMRVTAYASPFISILVLLIVAGVLLGSMRMFGSEGDFKQAFSATTYAWIPRLIKGVLGLAVLFAKSSPSLIELQNPLMSNLGFLFDPKTQLLPYTLASSIDIFNIWTVVLLIIGFASLGRTSRGKSAAIVITWWIVVNLVSLIGPAMQAMKAH
jgi:hypothetical protein